MSAHFPNSIQRLIEAFSRLPGVGEKSAQRLAFHLVRSPDSVSRELGTAATELKENLKYCPRCRNITDEELCRICDDGDRDTQQVCVVEEPLDVLAFERAGVYRGVYHVLHGALNPLDGIGPEQLTIVDLVERVRTQSPEEVILAMNPSTEGEATAMYLTRQLAEFVDIRVSRIARGLPTGSELSYADEVTLGAALSGRNSLK